VPVNPERGDFTVLFGDLASGPTLTTGNGSPEGVVAAPVSSLYLRRDGGALTSFWVKETGAATSAGWVAK
jgi:hypothetical protein